MSYSRYCGLNLHIGASDREVIAAMHGPLVKKARRNRKHRTQRHELIRNMLKEHLDAR